MKSKVSSEEQTGDIDDTKRRRIRQPRRTDNAYQERSAQNCRENTPQTERSKALCSGSLPQWPRTWTIAAPVHLGFFHILITLSAAATVAGIGYCLLCIWAGVRFALQRNRPISTAELAPVSILKPLKGADPQMYEALRSHCLLDYPEYEILFGISDSNDPAIPIVEKLIREFPERRMRVVQCDKELGANGKVSSLAQLVPVAAHEILLVNDSDIRIQADYLRTVVAELQRPDMGLVTCLYRGTPAGTFASKLEALGISTDFVPGVLAARVIERGLHFGLGSTLAFRKSDLDAIGGFQAIADYLADDYELGRRIAEKGRRIELSRSAVETHLPAYDLTGFFRHQVRWARTIRTARPAGYAGLLLTFTLPWAALTLALAPHVPWAWALGAVALVARLTSALVSGILVLDDNLLLRSLWLLPFRDFLAVAVWITGWMGRKIVWRGLEFEIDHGKLKPVD
jgi:ceramide glucosyltransferase